jgi:hypothetical protein
MMVRGNASVQAFNCTIADNAADAIAGGIAATPSCGATRSPQALPPSSALFRSWGHVSRSQSSGPTSRADGRWARRSPRTIPCS